MGALSSWKTSSLFGNNVWIMGCTWLPNLSTCSLAVIRPWRLILGPTDIAAQTIAESPPPLVFYWWNQAFRIVGFLGCSPNVNSSRCREQREGRLIWPYHARVSSCLMSRLYGRDGTPSFTHLRSITFSNQRFSSCSPAVDVLDLWSSRRTVFVETASSRWIFSSAVLSPVLQ
jgi:hypothetical protein